MSFLKEKYNEEVVKTLMAQNNYKTIMEVPKIEKIVLNMGIGDATTNSKLLDAALKELELITSSKPIVTKAKKSIAGFNLRRTGIPIGCKVTIRGEKMYTFLEKLIHIVLPRVRDFRGLSLKSFDGRGNYSLGLTEQLIFPEIIYDDVLKVRGMDVALVTSAKTDHEALALLKALGLPFRKETN